MTPEQLYDQLVADAQTAAQALVAMQNAFDAYQAGQTLALLVAWQAAVAAYNAAQAVVAADTAALIQALGQQIGQAVIIGGKKA